MDWLLCGLNAPYLCKDEYLPAVNSLHCRSQSDWAELDQLKMWICREWANRKIVPDIGCLSVLCSLLKISGFSLCSNVRISHHHAVYIPPLPDDQFSLCCLLDTFLLHSGEKGWGHGCHGKWVYNQHLQTGTFRTKEWEISSLCLCLPGSQLCVQLIVLLHSESALKCL